MLRSSNFRILSFFSRYKRILSGPPWRANHFLYFRKLAARYHSFQGALANEGAGSPLRYVHAVHSSAGVVAPSQIRILPINGESTEFYLHEVTTMFPKIERKRSF
jgi:hypothetical protein